MQADAAHALDQQPKAKIFISYSRKDMAFADRLEAALKVRGFEPLIDRSEIYAFEDWWQRIQALIGRADTIVFVLSPDAVTSDVALKEVAHGAALNKRFAPIVCRRVDDAAVPEPLRRLNFIFFDDPERFEASADQLGEALQLDIGWIRQHTEFGDAARRWAATGRSGGLLLRSPVLEEAERWIAARPRGAPEPTAEMQVFVTESRRGATRRRNILTASLAAGLVIALGLAGVAYWQRGIAVEQRQIADQQRKRAEDTLAAATETANRLVTDLAVRFRDTKGIPTALIKDILDRARALQNQLIGNGETSPELRRSQARALNEASVTLLTLGESATSLMSAQQAKSILQGLLTVEPNNMEWRRALAFSDERMGLALDYLGKRDDALAAFRDALAILTSLVTKDPSNVQWASQLAFVYSSIGDALMIKGSPNEALTAYRAGLAIRQNLAAKEPQKFLFDLSQSYGNIGKVLIDQGKAEDALTQFRDEAAAAKKLTAIELNNVGAQLRLWVGTMHIASALKDVGKLDDALDACRES